MKRIKVFLFGVRQEGKNIIKQEPKTRVVTGGNLAWSYDEWRDEFGVSKKASEMRTVLQGTNTLTAPNLKFMLS